LDVEFSKIAQSKQVELLQTWRIGLFIANELQVEIAAKGTMQLSYSHYRKPLQVYSKSLRDDAKNSQTQLQLVLAP
jgi:hypothetical protein